MTAILLFIVLGSGPSVHRTLYCYVMPLLVRSHLSNFYQFLHKDIRSHFSATSTILNLTISSITFFVFLEFAASCLFATSAMTRSPPQFVFSESRRVPDLSQGRCCILRCTFLKECESLQFVCLS